MNTESNVQQIVAVRDSAMDAFGRPFFVPTTNVAIRSFRDEVNRQAQDNQMNQHPEDFELYHLGSYHEATGTFHNLAKPERLARAKDLIQGE